MKLGIFQKDNGKWIMGKDAQNGACCDTREIAEMLLSLHEKYYRKFVSFITRDGKTAVGRVTNTGIEHPPYDTTALKPVLFVRYQNATWKTPASLCELVAMDYKEA